MGQIRITPEQMRDRSKEVHIQRDTFHEVINKMETIISNLQDEWEGEAARGYESQFNSLRPSFNSMKELLDALGQQLFETARELEELDRRIAGKFKG